MSKIAISAALVSSCLLAASAAQAAGPIYQSGDLLYRAREDTGAYLGHAGLVYTGGAQPKVADVTVGRDPHALKVVHDATNFETSWTRRHPAFRAGLPSIYKSSMKARIDYYNSYRTEYDGAHNNQKGELFEYVVGTRHYWEFDCVGFTERVYEDIGLNLTSGAYESGGGWPLTPYEQRDAGVTIPAETHIVAGDYNGDGRTDLALTGGPGWTTLPVAFSDGGGGFGVTNYGIEYIPGWSRVARTQAVSADFNGDGRADIAIPGGVGFGSVPIAFSNGDGSFWPAAPTNTEQAALATTEGVQAVAGDFDGDGLGDIALPGGINFNSIPVLRSLGDSRFATLSVALGSFPGWAKLPGVKIVAGDFNGDRRSDIALVGGPGWTTIPVAFSQGNGAFSVTNYAVASVPGWAQSEGVKVVAVDVNRDSCTDLVVSGGPSWASIPVAFSACNGNFSVTNNGEGNFSGWAQSSGVKLLGGDFNGDGYGDISLNGAPGWGTIPVGFSQGNGSFGVTNAGVSSFPGWALSQ